MAKTITGYWQRYFFLSVLTICVFLPVHHLWAQFSQSTKAENGLLEHGIEQYQHGFYNLAANSLSHYVLEQQNVTVTPKSLVAVNLRKANYYLMLSRIREKDPAGLLQAQRQLSTMVIPDYKSHVAFNLGHYYYQKDKFDKAVYYFEQADISYFDNETVADLKFEQAYSYFNNNQLSKAKPLFRAIKDLPDNKYYIPANYYYGLLAYGDKEYKKALESFKIIDDKPEYKPIVPYYEAEIYYFLNKFYRVLGISRRYLSNKDAYYKKEMQLLTGQVLFEQKKYADALPYFEFYYKNSDKIRKGTLYELAYTYYKLKDWHKAINRFKPLSNAHDSLGQAAMYLLGDCYLKINDKNGARNAFRVCANMDFVPKQKEAASFLFGKLSDDLGYSATATKSLNAFIHNYPNSEFKDEAGKLLSKLLTQSNNYAEAFKIMGGMSRNDYNIQKLYQRVAIGRALQLIQNNQLQSADSVLNLSLENPVNPVDKSVAYFWKSEIAYRQKKFTNAIANGHKYLRHAQGLVAQIKKVSTEAIPSNAQMIIGYAQMTLGDYSHASRAFAQAKKLDGNLSKRNAIATLQEADAYFMQKNFEKARMLYMEAVAKGVKDKGYARYQISILDGLLGNMGSKKQVLQKIIAQKSPSEYHYRAQYELAVTYLNEGALSQAIAGFKILQNSPDAAENLKAKSLSKLAYAHQLNHQGDTAISEYKTFLKTYPADTGRTAAIEALRSLFVAKGQPNQFVQFLKENNIPSPNQSVLENTFYDAAIQDFNNEEWDSALKGFNTYFNKFPNGKYAVKAHFYRGMVHEKLSEDSLALVDYDAVLNKGWSDFSAFAASNAARICYNRKDFKKAQHYYARLRDVTVQNDLLKIAYEGLMKTAFKLDETKKSAAFADTLMSLPKLPKDILAQAKLYKARSLQMNRNYSEAIKIFHTLDTLKIGAVSAEARYRIAEISFAKGQLKNAEKEAGYAVQSSNGQDYWVVKCYILLGDILTDKKDYFNAKATLSSIVKNTNFPDLKQEASVKLNKVKALEQENTKLEKN